MKDPFTLLLVHGDGSRVLRVCLPRWIVYGTLGSVAAVATATIGLSGGYVLLERESGQMAALRQRADDERVLDSFQTRIAAVRSEIKTWKALHTKMWKAFGLAASSDPTPRPQAPNLALRESSTSLRRASPTKGRGCGSWSA